MKPSLLIPIILAVMMCTVVCRKNAPESAAQPGEFRMTSTAFAPDGEIPEQFTCKGNNISVPLAWSGAPEGTKSFAIIMDDHDAARVVGYTWIHWIAYNIPASVNALPEQLGKDGKVTIGQDGHLTQGMTSFKRAGYGGPCPPQGTGVHHYSFRLYALSIEPQLPGNLDKENLLKAMQGKILAETQLVGTYEVK